MPRVLLVDDDLETGRLLRRLLQARGVCDVTQARRDPPQAPRPDPAADWAEIGMLTVGP
jgi:CheY-like chemotaxis protein